MNKADGALEHAVTTFMNTFDLGSPLPPETVRRHVRAALITLHEGLGIAEAMAIGGAPPRAVAVKYKQPEAK
jgi:hypothetical protein